MESLIYLDRKIYKGVSHNSIMKKSGDLCFSDNIYNSLSLNNSNSNSLCSNFGVTTTS